MEETPAERTPLEEFKIYEYMSMGFTLEQAEDLCDIPGLYASSVREMFVRKGCTTELAYRILSST